MIRSVRSSRNAWFVGEDNGLEVLNRIPFGSDSYTESDIQQLLADHPELIPASSIDQSFNRLVLIGREIPVGFGDSKGYIDNLYITPSGKLVVVETKLYRNQEARRVVVSQIIEYAKELQTWDAEKLNACARDYYFKATGQAMNIIDIMASEKYGYLTFEDEAELTDNINENLASAAFLLLIIGDGIRSNVHRLADFLNSNTSMRFNLGLIEMEMYEFQDGRILIPHVLTQTTIIDRNVFEFSCEEKRPYIQKPLRSRTEFIAEYADRSGSSEDDITDLILRLESISGIDIIVAPTEMRVKFSCGGRNAPIMVFTLVGESKYNVYLYPDQLINVLNANGVLPQVYQELLDFYEPYVDWEHCRVKEYKIGENRFYFGRIGDILRDKLKFESEIRKFMDSVSEGE